LVGRQERSMTRTVKNGKSWARTSCQPSGA
jgi:hypothetical protein